MQSIFTNQNILHLAELLFWLIGAFLIGYYFGSARKPKKNQKKQTTYHSKEDDHIDLEDDISKIRAKKTFERGGKETVKTVFEENEPTAFDLNFAEEVTITTKDDLQKIKGIDSAIEVKLNEIGIYNLQQIANLTNNEAEKITELLKLSSKEATCNQWVEQANKLINNSKKN
jgi:predicted flap endonuclease-1-like 5' DNA nuclease